MRCDVSAGNTQTGRQAQRRKLSDNKVPLCHECVTIYKEQPEKRELLLAPTDGEKPVKSGWDLFS